MRPLQQSLVVKQDRITRLNQDGARLVADLSHAQKAQYEQQSQSRKVDQKLATLQDTAQQAKMLAAELAGKGSQVQIRQEQLRAAAAKSDGRSVRVRDLELALAAIACEVRIAEGSRQPRYGLILTLANGRRRVLRSKR